MLGSWIRPDLLTVIACLASASTESATSSEPLSVQDANVFKLRPEVVRTPFLPQATPLPDGPIRAALIATFGNGRDLLELTRRVEMAFDEVLVLSESRLGFEPSTWRKYNRVEGYFSTHMTAKLRRLFLKEQDVIIVGRIAWPTLPEDIRSSILERVRGGTGLVIAFRDTEEPEAFDVDLGKRLQPVDSWGLLPWEQMTIADFGGIRSIRTRTLGAGRVVLFDWPLKMANLSRSFSAVTLPGALDDPHARHGWSYEFAQALAVKAVLWAARRDPVGTVRALDVHYPEVRIRLGRPLAGASADYFVRDLTNRVLQRGHVAVAADGTATFRLEHLPRGRFSCDIILRRDGKAHDYAAASFVTAGRATITSLELEAGHALPGQTIEGDFLLDGALDSVTATLGIYDAAGRLLATRRVLSPDRVNRFSLTPIRSPRMARRVVVELRDGATLLDQREQTYLVDHRDSMDSEYTIAAWLDWPDSCQATHAVDELYRNGVRHVYQPHYFAGAFDKAFRERAADYLTSRDMGVAPYIWREYTYARRGLRDLIRKPCLTSPEHRQHAQERLKRLAATVERSLPLFCSLGDEPYLLHFWKGVYGRDVCFSPTCLASFREFLRAQYKTTEALNLQWETDYESFEKVMPVIYQDATKGGNLSPWVDHRLHMGAVFLDALRRARDAVKAQAPRAKVGPEGFFGWDPYKGYDWPLFAREFDFLGPYGPANGFLTNDLLIQFADPAKRNVRLNIDGWYPDTNPSEPRFSKSQAWISLMRGTAGVLYWTARPGPTPSAGITASGDLLPYWKDSLASNLEIADGPFQLLRGTQRLNRETAIYYSLPSWLATWTPPDGNPETLHGHVSHAHRQMEQWLVLLKAKGLDNGYVDYRDVRNGILERTTFRHLVLPNVVAMSEDEIQAVREFAGNGGTVIADRMPAVMDEHGKRREVPPLQAFFAESPRARLLDTLFLDYREKLKAGDPYPLADRVADQLESLGVRQVLSLRDDRGRRCRQLEMVVREHDDARYVLLVKHPWDTPKRDQPFRLRFGKACHVYNVRAGTYLGEIRQLDWTYRDEEPVFLALLPYSLESLEWDGVEDHFVPGQPLRIGVKLTGGTGPMQRHVLRVELRHTSDLKRSHRIFITTNGRRADGEIHTALNDQGAWRLIVTDVATGKTIARAMAGR